MLRFLYGFELRGLGWGFRVLGLGQVFRVSGLTRRLQVGALWMSFTFRASSLVFFGLRGLELIVRSRIQGLVSGCVWDLACVR